MLNKISFFIVQIGFLSLIFLSTILSTASAGQVNAFIYHRFDETKYPSTNISSDIFRQQLEYLKQYNIPVIGLEDVARRLNEGVKLPDHAVALSVDDGYASFYEIALPIIEEYGFPVSLFVNTDAVGKHGYMSWEQLKDAEQRGIVIANHTASHPYLVETLPGEKFAAWKLRIKQDIQKAQVALETHLKSSANIFVYPYGEYCPEVIDIVKSVGFDAAFAQQSGVIYQGSDSFVLPRFPMGGPFATLKGFISKLNMKPLIIRQGQYSSPVIVENPPTLRLNIEQLGPLSRVNCFVQGENSCWLEKVSGQDGGWYEINAEKRLTGRRNKYTITVQNNKGEWLWFSHLWINAKQAVSE